MTTVALGTLAVAGLIVAPAIQAQENRASRAATRALPRISGEIGAFTPAAADPKLAALLARAGVPERGLRFTPSDARRGSRAVTVAVRARSTRAAQNSERSAAAVSLEPIAYNLGVSVGWKRFAVSGDLSRVDLVAQPGGTERVDVGVSYSGTRASGRIQAGADRPLANTPQLMAEKPSYSIDVGGSYSLTRNLDVTAGVRYKSERDRLPRLTDERRDSQSVYVGTAFRF